MDKRLDRSFNSVFGTVTRDHRGAKQRGLILFRSRSARIHCELKLPRAIRPPDAALGKCRRIKPALIPQPRAGRHGRLVSGRFKQIPASKQQFVLCLRIRRRRNSSCSQISAEDTLQCHRPAALLILTRERNANKTWICRAKPKPLIGENPKLAGSVCTRAEQQEHQTDAASEGADGGGAFGGGHRFGRYAGNRLPQSNVNNHGVKLIFAQAWMKREGPNLKTGSENWRLTAHSHGRDAEYARQTDSLGVRRHSDFPNRGLAWNYGWRKIRVRFFRPAKPEFNPP